MAEPINSPSNHSALTFTHLGAAGWSITDGQTVILMDPYLSRVRFEGRRFGPADATTVPGDTRPLIKMSDPPIYDTETVDKHAPRADYILATHTHFNHCMDVPYIARKTGAKIIGSESTINVALNGGVPDDQLYAVKGGEDYAFPEFSLKVIPSLHSALSCKLYRDFGTVPLSDRPLSLNEYVEGGTFAYLLRFAGREILLFGSMNYIEREVEGLRPDAAFIASSSPRLEIHKYTERLLLALGKPRIVVATHWDDQGLPFGAPQDKALAGTKSFIQEVESVAPDTRIVVPLHFEPFVWDKDDQIHVVAA